MKNDLPDRDGLPEHLKILLDQHPKEGWSDHKNFSELTKFWLNRHLMFRKALDTLQFESNSFLNGDRDPQHYAAMISRVGGFFINELHGHHHIEDNHYFPLLIPQDKRLASGFELLDHDHQQLDGLLNGMAESANDVIGKIQTKSEASMFAADSLQQVLGRFEKFLHRHLTDEEELIVPIILEYNPQMG